MCNIPEGDILRPEFRLATLMSKNLEVSIDPKTLKLFIQLHWKKICVYAHKIHDELEPETQGEPPCS